VPSGHATRRVPKTSRPFRLRIDRLSVALSAAERRILVALLQRRERTAARSCAPSSCGAAVRRAVPARRFFVRAAATTISAIAERCRCLDDAGVTALPAHTQRTDVIKHVSADVLAVNSCRGRHESAVIQAADTRRRLCRLFAPAERSASRDAPTPGPWQRRAGSSHARRAI